LLTLASQFAAGVLDESLLLFDRAVSGLELSAKAKIIEPSVCQYPEPARRGEQ